MRQQQLKFGLEGKSQLHLGAMVREAWLRSRQPSPWFALLTLLWLMIIYGCVDQLPALLVVRGMTDNQAQALAALLATIISAPVSATLDVMGLKIALGQRIDGEGEDQQHGRERRRERPVQRLAHLLLDQHGDHHDPAAAQQRRGDEEAQRQHEHQDGTREDAVQGERQVDAPEDRKARRAKPRGR